MSSAKILAPKMTNLEMPSPKMSFAKMPTFNWTCQHTKPKNETPKCQVPKCHTEKVDHALTFFNSESASGRECVGHEEDGVDDAEDCQELKPEI
jgi:hypothetical protein